ncbi:MAG: ABC transporter substrate-binding protein [Oscillospiraceae bacterium]
MKLSKRILATLCVLAMVAAIFAGCNSGGSSSSSTGTDTGAASASTASTDSGGGEESPAASGESKEFSFMTWESEVMNQQILESFKKFEDQHPGVTIKLTPAPLADYGTKIKSMISANSAPDVFMVGNDWVIQYGTTGNLYDWTALAEADGIMDTYYPGVVENWKVDGKLYGFPGLLNTYGIFYNKDTFDAAGVDYPKDGWSYQDMLEKAAALTSEDGDVHVYGVYTSARMDPFFVSTYPKSAGDLPFAELIKGNTQVQASPKFREVVGLIGEATQNKYITDWEFTTSNAATMFMEGKMPMMTAGQWYADEFIRNAPETLNWGFVSWPVADASNPAAIYDCTGWASSANISDPETIYQVIKFIHTEMYADVLPQTPVAPSAAVDFAQPYYDKIIESGHPEMVDAMKYMLECENKLPVRFLDTYATDAQKFIDDGWGPIINGTSTDEAIDKLVENINAVIAMP